MNKSIKNQRLLDSCSACGRDYGRDNISLVLKEQSRTLLHVTCPHCKTAVLVTISASLRGTVGLGIVTDLGRYEIEEKIFSEKISADEILDVYEVLNG